MALIIKITNKLQQIDNFSKLTVKYLWVVYSDFIINLKEMEPEKKEEGQEEQH